MTPKPPLDFGKIEALRKHMLLTRRDMAALLGVTRMTYYGWVKGKPIRASNDANVRVMLRKLLAVMSDGWPTPDIIAATREQRIERLQELLNH
jgi:DNA-binding XRE family transcriptional regulator